MNTHPSSQQRDLPPLCVCCGDPYDRNREDPWEGRLDGYCYECATARCDAYPDECPRCQRMQQSGCSDCARLRALTRQGKARTYGISLSGGIQLPTDEAEREAWERRLSDVLCCFTGGWTIVELGDDEQVEYEAENAA